MNKHLQNLFQIIQQGENLTADQKNAALKSVMDADKELEITSFKLDRTEKVKRTTAILLEETIEELEQKRKAVEAQNRELEIESALERVRTVAMSMNRRDDMLHVCHVISEQLQYLDVQEIRNVQTAIFYQTKGTYINYEFYAKHDKTQVTEVDYKNHPVQKGFADQMLKGPNEIFIHSFNGKEVQDWYQFQKTTNVFIDTYLESATSLNYHWYSLGPVALGISTYKRLSEEQTNLFKRFVKVFELSYRRYLDIEKAEAQAFEAKVEASLEKMRAVAMSMNKPGVNKELVDELQSELKSGNTAEAIAISNDIKDNEEKINHHGKRADAIVKGMLQHSRSSTGVKEPTDINALADEYLRLAYHGLRAKDKSFNATMKTDYDETLEKVNVIPQDIGRVILNLITNAFYAMHEKSKPKTNGYEPTIFVSTKKMDGTVFISVKDNGGGIPQKVVDKIFQPFFTTKPTGEGTGLGLSLSYDIVKAHGGEIKVETKEGEGSEFVITLPFV